MKKVFILGNPRSGTSLLRIICNCHPHISAPPECGFMQWWYDKYKNWSEKSLIDGTLEMFLDDFFTSKKVETWKLDEKKVRKYLLRKVPSDYTELTSSIYYYWGVSRGKKPEVVLDKNNYYIKHLDEISEVWPDAYYIYLFRDGRDVACSYKDLSNLKSNSPYQPKLPVEISQIAESWYVNNIKIIEFLEQYPSERFIWVSFEDIILNTEESLRKICGFLELTFTKEMLFYHQKNREKEIEPKETLDWKKKTLEAPDPSKIGRYRRKLSLRERNKFNCLTSDLMNKLGYE